MAIISSYTIGTPTVDDYLIGTDDPGGQGPTKNFTLQSIINLVSGTLGDNNFYLSGISSNSSTGAITFTVTGGSNQTLTLGTAAFKATTHFALATDLTTHINDSTQPHSLDSIVTAQSLVVTKLQGITTNGTSGQLLASNGSGGLTFVSDQDENDNYFLSAVTRPDSSSNNVQFTISGGGSNVTSNIFGEAAFLSKSDIRTDVQNNLTYTAADFSFLGDLATKDIISTGDLDDDVIINQKILDGAINEEKLNITNTPVTGYVLTAGSAAGTMSWVQNSASNYFLDGISKSNETLTFSINGGTNVTYTFGEGAFANFGSTANDVAVGNHTHVLADITDSGALASKDTTGTSDIANNAVTLAKLSDSSATNGQILSVNSSGNLEFISSSAVAVPAVRLLPSSIGSASQIIRVNSGASATEYVTLAVAKTEFATGNSPSAGKVLGLDSNNDLQWVDSGTASIGTDTLTSAKINFFENTLSIAAGKILVASSGGTKFDSVAMSGDIAIASSGATTIQANAVETAMIADDNVTPAKINILDDSLAATSAHILIGDGTDFGNVAVSGDIAIAANGATTIQDDTIAYTKLAAEFTTKAVGSTISDGGSMSVNFTQFGVFEATMPGSGSSGITLTFSNADIGMTKVIILNAPSGSTYGGAVAFNQDAGTATLKRLSSDNIVKTANAINYIQVTCIAKSGNDRTYIYTVGQAQ
tara:strand:+ start:2008 stop:4119 length:2112 start_codon:yes stop_codon:yes gene_type:complete